MPLLQEERRLAKVCRSKAKAAKAKLGQGTSSRAKRNHKTHVLTKKHVDEAPVYSLFKLTNPHSKPLLVTLQMNGADLEMEVDTGAAVSVVSAETYRTLWPKELEPALHPANVKLRTYTREELPVLGTATVTVGYQDQEEQLSLLVVEGNDPSLLGRDWLRRILLNWKELHHLESSPAVTLADVLNQHAEVGTVKGSTARIHVDPEVKPRFCCPRPVPYALRNKVEVELERLEREVVIEPVQFSDWAAPIVPVVKRDGSIRICGDYKVTVSKAAKVDSYPLPRIDDLFASLSGGLAFSKLDLAHAYQQLPLEDSSRQLVMINTHRGLYRYNRLPLMGCPQRQ